MIVSAILAVSDPARPELGQIAGGLPMIVKDVLGPGLGTLFLIDVVFAVFVCALAVHAGSVRLIFAMARDNNLPMARALGRVPRRTQCPTLPALLVGALATGLLVVNIQLSACHRDPLLGRDHLGQPGVPARDGAHAGRAAATAMEPGAARPGRRRTAVLDGPARPADQRDRVALGRLPRREHLLAAPEIYGPDPRDRFAAPLATLGLLASGGLYYAIVQRRRTGGTLAEHRPEPLADGSRLATAEPPLDGQWLGRLAANE